MLNDLRFLKTKIHQLQTVNREAVTAIREVAVKKQSFRESLKNPCLTKEEFLNLEAKVIEDPTSEEFITQLFNTEGSKEYSKFVRNNLRAVIKDSAARNFNWIGSFGNVAIGEFKIIKLLIDCTLSKFAQCSASECESIIKSFFRDAKTRYNSCLVRRSAEYEQKTTQIINQSSYPT